MNELTTEAILQMMQDRIAANPQLARGSDVFADPITGNVTGTTQITPTGPVGAQPGGRSTLHTDPRLAAGAPRDEITGNVDLSQLQTEFIDRRHHGPRGTAVQSPTVRGICPMLQ